MSGSDDMDTDGPRNAMTCPECDEPLTVSTVPVTSTYGGSSADALISNASYLGKRHRKSFLDKLDLSQFQSSTKLEVKAFPTN